MRGARWGLPAASARRQQGIGQPESRTKRESWPDDGSEKSSEAVDQTISMGFETAFNDAEGGFSGDSMPLECFLAYEDLLTGLRAKRVLDRVLKSAGDCVLPRLQLLRFDLLGYPELHYWAAREAAQADLVVLSSHGKTELPEAVKSWLDLWLCRRGDRPSALVASLDERFQHRAEDSPIITHLRGLAAESGSALFTHFGGMSQAAVRLTIRCIRNRLCRARVAGESISFEARVRGLRWGINE